MLGDDMMDGTHTLLGTLKHAAGSAIKGGLMFGAIALAVGAVAAAAIAFSSGVPVLAGIAAFGGNIIDIAVGSAVIGGGVIGAASLIPGKDEGFGLRNLFKRRERTTSREREPAQDTYMSADNKQPLPSQNAYMSVDNRQPAPTPASHSSSTPYAHPHTTIVNNSPRTEVHSRPEAPRTVVVNAEAPAQVPQIDTPRAEIPASDPQFAPAAFPPKDQLPNGQLPNGQLMDEPNPNPYFRAGRGMEALQKSSERNNEPALQK